MSRISRANVYVDGFNFYFCAVKGTSYKWLDFSSFTQRLFSNKSIQTIKYFTARISALPHDPDGPARQDIYWRALRTLPALEIIQGNFVAWPKRMPKFPLVYTNTGRPAKVRVLRTEEKGSDVNLASHLVFDMCTQQADEAIVVSNDSDLAKAVSLVTGRLNKVVTVVNPNRSKNVRNDPAHCAIHKELRRVASACVYSLNESLLASSQFPSPLRDSKGTFTKPASW